MTLSSSKNQLNTTPPRLSRQEQLVRSYFDQLSTTYAQRFYQDHSYHQWLYEQRLNLATRRLDLIDKKILDVGAGTGALYDHLLRRNLQPDYYACDLSAGMLRQSNIPRSRRYAGCLKDLPFQISHYDYIFFLGVTSYMDRRALEEALCLIPDILVPGGTAVLSFTNRRSADYQLRRWLRPLIRRCLPGAGVISQDFTVSAYIPEEVLSSCPPHLKFLKTEWFNPILPPWERLTPKVHRQFAGWSMHYASCHPGAAFLFGDFLLFLERVEEE